MIRKRFKNALSTRRKVLLATAGILMLAMPVLTEVLAPSLPLQAQAQAPEDAPPSLITPQKQIAPGGPPPIREQYTFDTATIKPNKTSDPPRSNVQLDAGDVYVPIGGAFASRNFSLFAYIIFAYRLNPNQFGALAGQLPAWANTDHFDIDARAQGNPTKDQLRQMMRSLLADRFKLALHTDTAVLPVFSLTPVKPGELGPQLRAHPKDPPCATPAVGAPPVMIEGGFPAVCGAFVKGKAAPGHIQLAARNMTMELIGSDLGSIGQVGRPILDRTGLYGTFDLIIDWMPPAADAQGNQSPAAFIEALKNQLGLQLEPQMGPVNVPVIDHIEQLAAN